MESRNNYVYCVDDDKRGRKKMTCPFCGGKAKVVDSASNTEEVVRKRKCLDCGKLNFTTERDIEAWKGADFINEYKYKKYRELKQREQREQS